MFLPIFSEDNIEDISHAGSLYLVLVLVQVLMNSVNKVLRRDGRTGRLDVVSICNRYSPIPVLLWGNKYGDE